MSKGSERGWFARMRRALSGSEAAEERRLRREAEEARAAHDAWAGEVAELEAEIEALENYEDLADEFGDDCPIITKRGEEALLVVRGCALVETRRPRATYRGGSSGMSFRIAKGVYWRVGGHRGAITPAPEETTLIDGRDGQGVLVVTNRRGVFAGNLHTREFRWDRLVSVRVERLGEDLFALQMPVENRQRVSGVVVDEETLPTVHSRIRFGVSLYQERGDRHIDRLREQLAGLRAARPPRPLTPPPAGPVG